MRADAIWTFFKKVTKCRLLFLSKSDLRIFEKPGETKILTDGTVAEISFCPAGVQRAEPFVQGMQRGGSSMLGLRGKAHYRVKGETPCPGKVDACVNLYWVLPDAKFAGFAASPPLPRPQNIFAGRRKSV